MVRHDFLADLLLLSHAVRRVLQDEVVREYQDRELNICRINTLRLLAHRGAQSINNLALFLGLSKAAVSQNIDVLCRQDFTARRDDTRDRRTTWVSITPAGRRVLDSAERRQRARIRRLISGLPRKTERKAGDLLRDLAVTLIGISGESDVTCLQCCAFRSAGCLREAEGWSCSFLELTGKRAQDGAPSNGGRPTNGKKRS